MADIHVLEGSGGRWRVVAHLDVPDANNFVGVNYRTALVSSGLGGTTVLADGDGTEGTISAAEKTLIQNGSVYEHVFNYELGDGNAASLLAELREQYAQEDTQAIARLQNSLRFFGHTATRS